MPNASRRPASVSPYSKSKSLKFFLSYASEDQQICDAIANCLSAAFGERIELARMSNFQMGRNWRKDISGYLNRADVLIAIASGRLKPGHSFTGYEIGAFDFSRGKSEAMVTYPRCSRLAIPFAVLCDVPPPLQEYEGVYIDATVFEAANHGDGGEAVGRTDDVASDYNQKIFKFLWNIETLLNKGQGKTPEFETQDARRRTLQDHARSLFQEIKKSLSQREKKIDRPQSKLTFRIESGSDTIRLADAKVFVEGPCRSAFGMETSPSEPISWRSFAPKAADDIKATWTTTLERLMSRASKGEFIDDRLSSFDREKTLRVFISKVVRFFNDAREFHMYVVDLMRPSDLGEFGDHETTLLQSALRVGLTYRSMFLEKTSQFRPQLMRLVQPADLPEQVRKLTRELDFLLQFAREHDLEDVNNIAAILGEGNRKQINNMYRVWGREYQALMNIAQRVSTASDGSDVKFLGPSFIKQLTQFCQRTAPLNEMYVRAIILGLQDRIALRSVQREKSNVTPIAAVRKASNRRGNGRSLLASANTAAKPAAVTGTNR
jgi:hypothetical protein